MSKSHVILLAILISFGCRKQSSEQLEVRSDSIEMNVQSDAKEPSVQYEPIRTTFKLYYENKLVDYKTYAQFAVDFDCFNSIQFDSTISSFVTNSKKDPNRDCNRFTVVIRKGGQRMAVNGIGEIDSLSFREGEFYRLRDARKNTLIQRIAIGGTEGGVGSTKGFVTDTIQKKDFLKFKRSYNSNIDTDFSRVEWTDTTFIVKTGNSKLTYQANDKKIHDSMHWYLGFIKPLNVYVIKWVDGSNEVSGMNLIDNATERFFDFNEPPFITEIESPLISPLNKYILYYSNDYDDRRKCFISIMKINWSGSKLAFEDFYGFVIDKFKINELVWINDSSFAIQACQDVTDSTFYFRVRFSK